MRTIQQLISAAGDLDTRSIGGDAIDIISEMLVIISIHEQRITDLEAGEKETDKRLETLDRRIAKLERTLENFVKLNSPVEFVPSPPEVPIAEMRIQLAIPFCISGNHTDGDWHKQWCFDQITRALLTPADYERFRAGESDWDEGIAP